MFPWESYRKSCIIFAKISLKLSSMLTAMGAESKTKGHFPNENGPLSYMLNSLFKRQAVSFSEYGN
jgi:hypothetical protein